MAFIHLVAIHQDLCSLLTGLLEKGPKDRMKLHQLKEHPWFADMKWEALARQELEAPHPEELSVRAA